MTNRINPFNEVYVTESIGSEKFVSLFSPILVESALGLYQPGHIVLKGLMGTGKSMLLSLLKPEIRLSYFNANIEFPVPKPYHKFIGAGINLRRSGISDFGQRAIVIKGFRPNDISPIFFGDFLNYWIVADILKSLECLGSKGQLAREVGINVTSQKLDAFAKEIAKEKCWYDYLENVNSYEQLKSIISDRITQYRKYLNYNIKTIDAEIVETKSDVGLPIIQTAHKLKELGIVDNNVEFYVRLDQYEDLERLNSVEEGLGTRYQEIVHKLLGMRDFSVSYKIGTRDFAWTKKKKYIYKTNTSLERKRDYNEVSIEEIFKRSENTRSWLFPRFAEDIFQKRLVFAGYEQVDTSKWIVYVFGNSLSPSDKIDDFYVRSDEVRRNLIKIEEAWPDDWKVFLQDLAETDILSAKLGEAWARQKGKADIVQNIPAKLPWNQGNKKWWRKERIEQALMQIASRNKQRLHWSGYEDMIDLSGGSILAFIYLCKYIWDGWLKDNRYEVDKDSVPKIGRDVQSLGIEKASYYWYEDINQESGGDKRKKFIRYIGNFFYDKLLNDLAMTYPGHNGFSMSKEDLESSPLVNEFLRESSDYGDLDHREHTSRVRGEGKRIKWHLSKILSPYFRVPSARTKEPMYVKLEEVQVWLIKSEAFQIYDFRDSKINLSAGDSRQRSLEF